MQPVHFTHLMTGKRLTIANPRAVAAVIHGPTVDANGKPSGTDHVWLVMDNVPNPVPVKEDEDTVLKALGLKE